MEPYLVQLLHSDGIKEITSIVVDLPYARMVRMQRTPQLRFDTLPQLDHHAIKLAGFQLQITCHQKVNELQRNV